MESSEARKKRKETANDVASLETSKKLKEKPRVTFSSNLTEVFTFTCEDHGNSGYEKELSEGPGSATASERDTQRTSELTLLSSLHGRARRELRDIPQFDLKAAVKHGVRSRGRTCPKTRLPRWKYVYGNLVYITDYTSTVEVTSYKEAIQIQPATITAEMQARHEEDTQALRDDPQLCTTHAIIIIDQSGSMRTSDVNGFRTRSEMAYGVLALEYIAEQLHSRGDDGTVDAVSIIEMSDCGTLFVDRKPLSWILFNELLHRQKTAKPRSHGNYNISLELAKHLVDRDIRESGSTEEEDVSSFAIVLLSDGRPSDKQVDDDTRRKQIVRDLALTLGPKLNFCAIGLGDTTLDFEPLRSLATTATAFGAHGSFEFPQLCAAKLSATFSSLSVSMTATRTDMLTVKEEAERKRKNIRPRDKHLPKAKRRFNSYTLKVSRWRYDQEKYSRRDYFPWSEIDFVNRDSIGFHMEEKPFGEGAERLAYMFHEIDRSGKRLGVPMVAKESNRIPNEERKVKFHENFCRVQREASKFAEAFNSCVEKAPNLQPVEKSMKAPGIRFLKCFVYEYQAKDGERCGLLVERFLEGRFTKYNGNNGLVLDSQSGPTMDLRIGEVFLTDFLQAFSHWVYFSTDHKVLVCDLQGVLNEEGRHPRFDLTDPCICTKSRNNSRKYGRTNLGVRGFRSFKRTHKCNKVCKGLGLPAFGSRK